LKVLKVVKAPRSPTVTSPRASGVAATASRYWSAPPIRAEPIMLTRKVPQGTWNPACSCTHAVRPCRATAPAAPPIAMYSQITASPRKTSRPAWPVGRSHQRRVAAVRANSFAVLSPQAERALRERQGLTPGRSSLRPLPERPQRRPGEEPHQHRRREAQERADQDVLGELPVLRLPELADAEDGFRRRQEADPRGLPEQDEEVDQRPLRHADPVPAPREPALLVGLELALESREEVGEEVAGRRGGHDPAGHEDEEPEVRRSEGGDPDARARGRVRQEGDPIDHDDRDRPD